MNKFYTLTKTLIQTNNYLNIKDSNNPKKTYFIVGLLLLTIAPIVYGLLKFTLSFYDTLSIIDQHGLILSLSFSSISLLIFFSSIVTVMSVLYFSMDLTSLLPLPFSSRTLIASKFFVMLIFQYLVEVISLLPILIGFGVKNGINLYYVFYSIITFITLPIIPLTTASIIVMVVMRFAGISKNKDQFKVLGGLIAIGLSISLYIFVQDDLGSIQSLSSVENIIAMGDHSLVELSSTLFKTTNLLTSALLKETLLENLVLLSKVLFFNLITFAVFLIVGQLTYFKGVLGITETASKNQEISHKKMNKITRQRPIQIAYMLKEIRKIIRTPAYLLNCVLGNFLWILLIGIAYFTTDGVGEQIEAFLQIFEIVHTEQLIIFSGFLIVFLSSAFNSIVQTSISREGTGFMVNKYLPINYSHQIQGKILSGLFFGGINILILLSVLIIVFKVEIYLIIIFIITSILSILFVSFTGLIIDLYNPKLDWSREQSAVKQNINVVLSFIPLLLISGLVAFISFIFNITFYWLILLIIILFLLFDWILYKILMDQGIELYGKI